ncbi:MAG: phosphate ABC transporter substrate-binding protein PstS family protein [Gammaproteobacteria bacterium]|nr:MAG: phosphate ABC transporter substrate-binding protein PstS family protein [Gammaproteobacteria bacterium]
MKYSYLFSRTAVLLLLSGLPLLAGGDPVANDTTESVQGSLALGGSVTLADLASLWVQDFRQLHPLVEIVVSSAGSEAGIAALVNGTAGAVLLGNSPSRSQLEVFRDKYGYAPMLIPVAMDAVAVYVNTLNPLRRITLTQLDAIFSVTHRCGEAAITDWQQLGIAVVGESARVLPYGLDDSTAVYQVFKQVALCNGDFRPDFQAMAGPGAVESAIASQSSAIGFSSSALRSAGIRPLAVARGNIEKAVVPDADAISSKRYPMSRTLLIAVNAPAGKPLSPLLQAFVDYVLSASGQDTARKAGYVPL